MAEEKKAKIIALTGKGGVGKTTLSAAFVRDLCEIHPEAKILAIDADPAVGLSIALGVEVKETLDDIRQSVIDTAKDGRGNAAVELLGEARYRIFDALVEKDGFAFLAIGRPEGAGCYCAINSYLKDVIDMVSRDFDYVVIDGEAGIEQINRRVMEKVTQLFMITDASFKGMQVVKSIKSVADELVMYDNCGIIINRAPADFTDALCRNMDAPVLAVIPGDDALALNDMRGLSIFELEETSPIMVKTKEIAEKYC